VNVRHELTSAIALRWVLILCLMVLTTWLAPVQPRARADPSEGAQEMQRMWKEHQEEFAGWDKETKGATWKQYLQSQPSGADELLMPKTIALVKGVSYWLDMDHVKEVANDNKDDADVKKTLAEAHKTLDTAAAKLNEAFNNVLSEAEKEEGLYKDEVAQAQVDNLRLHADAWFENTPYHDRNVARARKLKEKWEAKLASGEQEREALIAKLTADANAKWPAITSGIKAQEGFTPEQFESFKGKTIHLKGHNSLGSAYNPGDYDYSHDINGMCVAGKFTKELSDAVDKVTRPTGRDLPGEDWDVYAVVESRGQISRRTHAKGTITSGGQQIGTVTAEGSQLVPCVVIRIFAVHAGPVAATSNPGG
jgi:hypothetical protein